MGFAVAAEAARRGAEVTLVAGPSAVEPPPVQELVRVRTAAEMHKAVIDRADRVDIVVMAAAVADYTPAEQAVQKVPKGEDTVTLVLRKTPDILAELGRRRVASRRGPVLVGFAAETEDVVAHAAAKREAKHVDLIVANDVSRADVGFAVDTNEVTLVGPDDAEAVPLQSKSRVAAAILDRVERLLVEGPAKAGHYGRQG
jgi:phosphopantothenoylcysteine decarboxylase/phosphopantothenate--cysteine ligase